ncbi:aminomethyltransferase [Physcia stellaris]|nr:aminomethyltransferase [Physcia stellaris]
MSSNATPISPARFAAALPSLPLPNLHLKAAELRNSIAHLEYSNHQLQPLAEEGDRDCKEAVEENKETIARMEERIELLKAEVEGRGFRWGEGRGADEEVKRSVRDDERENTNGEVEEAVERDEGNSGMIGHHRQEEGRRRLREEELMRRIQEMAEDIMDEGDDGLHL